MMKLKCYGRHCPLVRPLPITSLRPGVNGDHDGEPLAVVDKIATCLGIKRDVAYEWATDKRMSAHKVGPLWKLRKEEVDERVRGGGAGDNKHPLKLTTKNAEQ
ncbi:hypothetical protein Tlie_0458 [Thermovirga lienii DSM 17291]|uniref:Helix-turn-helix domain-containing protein n=1 Tax=Thermovirga lienii (strain ATCC BAA-1197 / DSM 17291 / Cas60314) TaxID=580340 RepID=G7V7V7_THELD|nr:excisionase family DNA-binding protein [Thermovirga lienii]AER66193.1 hypothetical protein Tlie_0458 [Thermovirga lienii DSM 17291]